MNSRQTRFVVGTMVLTLLAWLFSPLFGEQRDLPSGDFPLLFDAAKALELTREFVTRFPRRVMGSIEARQSTGFLVKRFEGLGYRISYTHFDAVIADKRQVGRNVLASKAGQLPEVLALVAHYDTARTTVQGAMDNGSAVGVLLELARVFADVVPRRSLLFVASDGEEWGMLGALDLVRNYPERDRIAASLSLDYVAPAAMADMRIDAVGQMGGYTPPWLRRITLRAAQAEGMPVIEPFGLQEHLDRALLLSWTDQGPFLNAGIPAINLGSRSRDAALESAIYHSANDTIANVNVSSVEKFGRAAERILRHLDGLPNLPRESMEYFHVTGTAWLSPPVVAILHYLVFLPFVLVVVFYAFNHGRSLGIAQASHELIASLATFIPFLLFYYSIAFFLRLRLLPRYSFYPATPRDPILSNPAWGVLVGLFSIAIAAAVGCYLLAKYLVRNLPRAEFHTAKYILLLLYLIVLALAFAHNAYWTVTFLLLPAWIWGLVGASRGKLGRIANRLWILAAGIPCYLVSIFYASRQDLGWKVIWYQVLALSTGVITLQGFLLAAASIALGIRFMAVQGYGRGD